MLPVNEQRRQFAHWVLLRVPAKNELCQAGLSGRVEDESSLNVAVRALCNVRCINERTGDKQATHSLGLELLASVSKEVHSSVFVRNLEDVERNSDSPTATGTPVRVQHDV